MLAKLSRFIRFGIISYGNDILISLVIDGFSQLISHSIGLKTQLKKQKLKPTLYVGKGSKVKTLFYIKRKKDIRSQQQSYKYVDYNLEDTSEVFF